MDPRNGPGRVDGQGYDHLMFTCATGPLPATRSLTVYVPGRLIPVARPLPSGGAALPVHASRGA